MKHIKSGIDSITAFFAGLSGWLCLLLVLLTVQQVIARYVFNSSSIALQELQWHLFGFIFLLAAAHALKTDQHVRVDIIYSSRSPKTRALIDTAGILFFLLPVCGFLIYYGIRYTAFTLAFDNPRPPDHYTLQFSEPGTILYSILGNIEAILRRFVLVGEISGSGGLEARWIIKAAIPFGFLLLLLQALSLLIEKWQVLLSSGKNVG